MAEIFFVGAGPGDPDLITVKGLRLIEDADVLLYAGSLVNPLLVEKSHARIKLNSYGMKLDDQIGLLVQHAESGKKVVRLHSGDPSLYGAISEQIIELEKRGVGVISANLIFFNQEGMHLAIAEFFFSFLRQARFLWNSIGGHIF
jgi:precorrin-4/cobalt-precorrin-4 C11-methyltransferase